MGSYRDIAEELILSDFSKVREYIPRKRCRPRSEEEEFEPGGMAMVVRLSGV